MLIYFLKNKSSFCYYKKLDVLFIFLLYFIFIFVEHVAKHKYSSNDNSRNDRMKGKFSYSVIIGFSNVWSTPFVKQ